VFIFRIVKQHFVPRAYLSDFTDPNTAQGHEPSLWVYEREENAPYRRAPHKVAVKADYYTATIDGEREDAVEQVLSQVESRALPVIRDLARGRDPATLGEDLRGALALFLGFLETRVPKFRRWVEKNVGELMKNISRFSASHPENFEHTMREAMRAKGKNPPADMEGARQFALSGEYDVRVDPLMSLQMMVAQAPTIAEYVNSFEWRALYAPAGEVFITSDAPLVRVATQKPPAPWMGVGWATPWMEATFPLSPTACLLISQHRPTGQEQIAAERVMEINLRTAAYAEKEVYCNRAIRADGLNRRSDWRWWTPVTDEILPGFVEETPGSDTAADI
jgi:hypothetical protein